MLQRPQASSPVHASCLVHTTATPQRHRRVAWTVAGALGWALGALCSLRIVLHTLGIGRGASASAPSPALPAAPDGSPDGLDPKAASFLVAKEAGHALPPGASAPVPTEVGEVQLAQV